MVLTKNEDGSLTTTSSAKAHKGTVADRDISFEFFCLASVNMLEAMRSAAWPQDRITMFASFWSEIQEHPLRHTGEELDRRVLLLYQEEERLRWHHTAASSSDSPYDMSSVDAEILAQVKDKLYTADRERRFQLSVSHPPRRSLQTRLTDLILSRIPPLHLLLSPFRQIHTYSRPRRCRCRLPLPLPFAVCRCRSRRRRCRCRCRCRCPRQSLPATRSARIALTGARLNSRTRDTRSRATAERLTAREELPRSRSLNQPNPRASATKRGIFRQAQAGRATPLVPYVSADTSIQFSSAQPREHGTNTFPRHPREHPPTSSYSTTAQDSVCPTSSPKAAHQPPTRAGTAAPDVHNALTELSNALEHRKLSALTPYPHDVWKLQLEAAGLLARYPQIPDGLCVGFSINAPLISTTQAPPNKESIALYTAPFLKIVRKEITKGRYIAPLSRASVERFIGPFQSSPLSIIPKPNRDDEFRLLQNYSFPYNTSPEYPNPSINSLLQPDDFPTTWGSFYVAALVMYRLPPRSQLAIRDVVEAYRTVPLHPSQWPAAVVCLSPEEFAIDTCLCFGVSPSSGAYGALCTAGMDIMRFQGIGPISAWVDDHVFFRFLRIYLDEYNRRRNAWNLDIAARGPHHIGGRLFYGGATFEDGTLEEFNKDCSSPCQHRENKTGLNWLEMVLTARQVAQVQ